jgi:hypothetical protein
MTHILLAPFKETAKFIYWWVFAMPKRILNWLYDTVLVADEMLVLGETIRLWIAIEPMFGDYNWQGRIIGFLFRFARILVSLAFYLVILVIGLAGMLLWLVWPIMAVMLILRLW